MSDPRYRKSKARGAIIRGVLMCDKYGVHFPPLCLTTSVYGHAVVSSGWAVTSPANCTRYSPLSPLIQSIVWREGGHILFL